MILNLQKTIPLSLLFFRERSCLREPPYIAVRCKLVIPGEPLPIELASGILSVLYIDELQTCFGCCCRYISRCSLHQADAFFKKRLCLVQSSQLQKQPSSIDQEHPFLSRSGTMTLVHQLL